VYAFRVTWGRCNSFFQEQEPLKTDIKGIKGVQESLLPYKRFENKKCRKLEVFNLGGGGDSRHPPSNLGRVIRTCLNA